MSRPNTTRKIKITPAQISALQCADLDAPGPLHAAMMTGVLVVTEGNADITWRKLVNHSNSEDVYAELRADQGYPQDAKLARGAATALSNLALKVSKAIAWMAHEDDMRERDRIQEEFDSPDF